MTNGEMELQFVGSRVGSGGMTDGKMVNPRRKSSQESSVVHERRFVSSHSCFFVLVACQFPLAGFGPIVQGTDGRPAEWRTCVGEDAATAHAARCTHGSDNGEELQVRRLALDSF